MTKLKFAVEELKACIPGLLLLVFVLACGYLSQYLESAPGAGVTSVRSTK